MVYPENDVAKDFVCYACAAVGRTYQAVDTHMSDQFYEVEQKERPVECALCSVKDGMHAMHPLFDYHGKGGRQICVPVKTKNKNDKSGEKKLVWAHALCSLYLCSKSFTYPCYKDGYYAGMENCVDEGEYLDLRPPNPELKITNEFRRMYGAGAISHFRHYMTPPSGALDEYLRPIIESRMHNKCIECGLDDKRSMRIAVQCVANDPDEFEHFRDKHRDKAPCTQSLHVGCARWGAPSSTLRKCYYFPGKTNADGSIVGGLDTVVCLYCKTHAEDLDEDIQKRVQRGKDLFEKKKASEIDQLGAIQQRTIRSKKIIQQVMQSSKERLDHRLKKINKRPAFTSSKTNTARGHYRSGESDRRKALDSSMAVAINSGEQPTLGKRRRKIANDMSSVTKEDVNKIFEDLVSHQDEITKNGISTMNGRKRYWKHEFSSISTADFDRTWIRARKRFHEHQSRKAQLESSEKSTPTNDEPTDLPSPSMLDVEGEKEETNTERVSAIDEAVDPKSDIRNNGDGGPTLNITASKKMKRPKGDSKDQTPKRLKYPPDQWSNLFIGQAFEMGNEFTLEDSRNND